MSQEKNYDLLNYKRFMEELDDPEVARDFLIHIQGLSYEINEVKPPMQIKDLEDLYSTELAKSYYRVFFLEEWPGYGEEPH